jgi:hypothetical protein
LLDLAPPNWMWNLAFGTAPFRAFAQTIYFHQRGAGGAEGQDPVVPANSPKATDEAV